MSAPQIAAYVQALRSQIETHADLIREHAPAPAPGAEGRDPPARDLSAREVGRENDAALARSRRIVLGTGVVGLVTSVALSGVLASTAAMNSSIAIAVGCACGMIPFFIVFGIVLKKMSSMG